MHASSALALLFFTALVPAQGRIVIGGMPSNLLLNLSSTSVVSDPAAPSAFYALMPVQQFHFNFAVFDADLTMNVTYGSGNWLRCTMVATHWAYLSNDACAHQPAPGTTAPQSILMSDFDWGGWPVMPGTPNQPWPGATLFTGGIPFSVLQGAIPGMVQERWQLRTTNFWLQPWNACPPNGTITANFSGWLIARFTFSFQ